MDDSWWCWAIDDENNYLGSLTIGFDIAILTEMLKSFVFDDVRFALIDKNHNVLLQSSPFMPELGEPETNLLDDNLKKYLVEINSNIKHSNKVNINIMNDNDGNYLFER